MEEIEKYQIKSDLYAILFAVLSNVCERIVHKDSHTDEEDTEEWTIDNFMDQEDEDYEEQEDQEDYEAYDECDDIEAEIEKKEDSQAMELLRFLSGPDEKYDVEFDKIGMQMEYPFIQDYILYKHIMSLMITSYAYCGIVYDDARGIAKIDERILHLYEDIIDDPQSILQIFKNNEDVAKELVNWFLDYFYSEQYTRTAISWQLIKEQGKMRKLVRMNPLECLGYMNSYDVDDLTEAEIVIQNFRDAYDYVIALSYDEDLDEEERMNLLLGKFDVYYHHDQVKVNQAIAYIIGNVYENLILHRNDAECQHLAELIEDNSETLDAFVETFKEDADLFWTIVNYFYSFNYYLEPEDLALLRWNFKTGDGNVKVLKRLNHFYDDEEKIFSTGYFQTNE